MQKIVSLKAKLDQEAVTKLGRRAHTAQRLYEHMYSNPILSVKEVSEHLNITPKSAGSLLDELIKNQVVREITGGKRGRLYSFDAYLTQYN